MSHRGAIEGYDRRIVAQQQLLDARHVIDASEDVPTRHREHRVKVHQRMVSGVGTSVGIE